MSVTKNNFEKPKFYNSHRSRQLSKKESIGPIKTQKSFIKNIGKYLVAILKILIRKKDKILISCHDYQDYSGNSRFLYEYLSLIHI